VMPYWDPILRLVITSAVLVHLVPSVIPKGNELLTKVPIWI